MLETIRKNWTCYLLEGFGLATFVFFAGLFSTLLLYPRSPLARMDPAAKNLLMALLMFLVVAWGIAGAPWMKRTGAHINPSVTLAFLCLGKISPIDATFYSIAQFGGAFLGVALTRLVAGEAFAHPAVGYAATVPGIAGPFGAFAVEFVITFVLVLVVLDIASQENLRKWAHLAVAGLISFYLVVATPFSGMSMNPARSAGSSLFSGKYDALWIYFAAPLSAALLAAELYRTMLPGRLTGPNYPTEGRKHS